MMKNIIIGLFLILIVIGLSQAQLTLDSNIEAIYDETTIFFSYAGVNPNQKPLWLSIYNTYDSGLIATRPCSSVAGTCAITIPKLLDDVYATAVLATYGLEFDISYSLGYSFNIQTSNPSKRSVRTQAAKKTLPDVWSEGNAVTLDVVEAVSIYWQGFDSYETISVSILQDDVIIFDSNNIRTDSVYYTTNFPPGCFVTPGSIRLKVAAPSAMAPLVSVTSTYISIFNSTSV